MSTGVIVLKFFSKVFAFVGELNKKLNKKADESKMTFSIFIEQSLNFISFAEEGSPLSALKLNKKQCS
mgnify:CR=1 FL=1